MIAAENRKFATARVREVSVQRSTSPAAASLPRRIVVESVARLSDADIHRMNRDDLIDLSCMARPWLPRQELGDHLPYMNDRQLRQIACLARQSCRLQVRQPADEAVVQEANSASYKMIRF